MVKDGDWSVMLDEVWPPRLRVGSGSVALLAGWIFHRRSPVVALDLAMRDNIRPIRAFGMPRIDVYQDRARPDDQPPTATYRSGFWAVVPMPGVHHSEGTLCSLLARTADGDQLRYALPSVVRAPMPAGEPALRDPARVAICMAAYEPDLELFRRQIESIRAQTHTNWRCVVSDDGSRPAVVDEMEQVLAEDNRFSLHRASRRLGAYFNFERALTRAAPDAELVALADQDDEWHADKLATLIDALGTHHVLAYSDMRLVRPDRTVISDTFWVGRQNQWRDLRNLVLSNTVTGAASLFTRELLDRVLPFPPRLPAMHHDHWLAVVVRAAGSIAYVDRPLYDYVQHPGQLVGHAAAREPAAPVDDEPDRDRERQIMLRWQRHYFERALPTQLMATALLERFGGDLTDDDCTTLGRLAAGDQSWAGWGALLATAPERRIGPTLGHGRDAVLGLVWRRLAPYRAGRSPEPRPDGRHSVWTPSFRMDYGPDEEEVVAARGENGCGFATDALTAPARRGP